MTDDPNHVPDLFGGPLTIETINRFKRALKSQTDDHRPRWPVALPAALYDRAKARGIDMKGYTKQSRD